MGRHSKITGQIRLLSMRANFTKLLSPSAQDKARPWLLLGALAALLLPPALVAQAPTATSTPAIQGRSGLGLYHALHETRVDHNWIYKVRDLTFDREDIHFSLEDGTIAFLQGVDGHVTGAFFAGDGELLIMPPSQRERSALALFTNAAQLDVDFSWAFFRFDDAAMLAQASAFRPLDDPENDGPAFLGQWETYANSLIPADSLMLATLLANAGASGAGTERGQPGSFLHAFFGGTQFGTLDVVFDTRRAEQISVGRIDKASKDSHYDLMLMFPMRSVRNSKQPPEEPFHVSDFEIHTMVKPPTQIEGEAILTLQSNRNNLRAIFLGLSRYLKVSAAQVEGVGPAEIVQNESLNGTDLARHGEDSLALFLPQALQTGTTIRLHLQYAGSALVDTGTGLLYLGDRETWYPHPSVISMAQDRKSTRLNSSH